MSAHEPVDAAAEAGKGRGDDGVLLATAAYERLRKAIVTGHFRPNERLVEADIADWLKLSRTPLREALAQLATEGLVERGRRGWTVRDHSRREVMEIHEVRAALESMAVYLAAERATDEQINRIASFHDVENEKEREKFLISPRAALVDYNDAFHEAIVEAAGNERLALFLRQNREFFFTYRIAKLYTVEESQASLEGHELVVQALRERDGDRGERAMRRHILEARDVIVAKLF
jgi:DNA-binding GntR family transcriptional regulator